MSESGSISNMKGCHPFCYACGRIGHTEGDCSGRYEEEEEEEGAIQELGFGPSLKAQSRQQAPNQGDRWLRHPGHVNCNKENLPRGVI